MKIQKSKLLFKLQRALCDKACDEVSHSGISAVNFLAPHCLQPHTKGASTSSGTSEHFVVIPSSFILHSPSQSWWNKLLSPSFTENLFSGLQYRQQPCLLLVLSIPLFFSGQFPLITASNAKITDWAWRSSLSRGIHFLYLNWWTLLWKKKKKHSIPPSKMDHVCCRIHLRNKLHLGKKNSSRWLVNIFTLPSDCSEKPTEFLS